MNDYQRWVTDAAIAAGMIEYPVTRIQIVSAFDSCLPCVGGLREQAAMVAELNARLRPPPDPYARRLQLRTAGLDDAEIERVLGGGDAE